MARQASELTTYDEARRRRERHAGGGLRRAGSRLLDESGEAGLRAGRSLHQAVLRGARSRRVADLLHGTWLGHPLHPVLTDVTIGAWTFGAVFDGIGAISGDRATQRLADRLTTIGTISAIPTALAGVTDYTTVPKPAAGTATLHALLNGASLGLYLYSLMERRRGRRRRGLALSSAALGANLLSAWLGGHLVYRDRVGVDHSERFDGPREWTQVLPARDLASGEASRVELDGKSVLVYRSGQDVYAIGAVCSHAGGPLEQGTFRDCQVQCPWHDSVFDLRDGSVRHGPATGPQPAFAARIEDGMVELRALRP
jgi:nitrite reductase/ring-hydroxylating ferredoxin subunit/uncharacterized membrane protein